MITTWGSSGDNRLIDELTIRGHLWFYVWERGNLEGNLALRWFMHLDGECRNWRDLSLGFRIGYECCGLQNYIIYIIIPHIMD